MTTFYEDIERFNSMYSLPHPTVPSTEHLPVAERMKDFKRILLEEVSEVDDLVKHAGKSEIEDLVALADWLGDLMIYAASEMRRFGIPVEQTLAVIMESNFSKLGEDGKPITKDGKVMKGPHYYKPEPKLKQMLEGIRNA